MCESDFRKLAFRKLLSYRKTLCDSTQWAASLRTGSATSCPYRMFALHHRQSMEITNGEGGIWTLAPLLTTYSLSRGAPSAAWVLLHKRLNRRDTFDLSNVSNGEGGIRTHAPLRTNGFQDRLVMTTSIPLHVVCTDSLWISARIILAKHFPNVNNFFKKFKKNFLWEIFKPTATI